MIQSNFLKLLRIGAFGEKQTILPMSPWKWEQVVAMANGHRLEGILAEAIRINNIGEDLNIPDRLLPIEGVVNYTMPTPMLLTRWRQRRLDSIYEQERHSIDTSVETLRLLDIIVANVSAIEQRQISLLYIIALGRYLRMQGQYVDFVKLENWISQLRMQRVASMLGSMLVWGFGFERDEIPFMQSYISRSEKLLKEYIGKPGLHNKYKHSVRLMTYSPWSIFSYWTTLIKDSLGKIEE